MQKWGGLIVDFFFFFFFCPDWKEPLVNPIRKSLDGLLFNQKIEATKEELNLTVNVPI